MGHMNLRSVKLQHTAVYKKDQLFFLNAQSGLSRQYTQLQKLLSISFTIRDKVQLTEHSPASFQKGFAMYVFTSSRPEKNRYPEKI